MTILERLFSWRPRRSARRSPDHTISVDSNIAGVGAQLSGAPELSETEKAMRRAARREDEMQENSSR